MRLLDVLVLLGSAMLLGALAERLRQSAIIGYLLAGMMVGPNVLGWVRSGEEVEVIAELGAALLLFTIGLEFSLRRLVKMGRVTFAGGGLQVVLTGALAHGIALALGFDFRTSVAVGAVIALSSTAFVLRVLVDTMQTESLMGRNAIGVLLFQDAAVVPLVLLVSALAGGAAAVDVGIELARTMGLAVVGIGVLFLILNYVTPPLFHARGLSRNRELPVLLTAVIALGSAWAAHSVGFSPAIGAFAAGLVLAESPFAIQIRADISALRTLLITLFFAAVGMFGDPVWVVQNLGPVLAVVVLVLVGKPLVIWGVLRVLGYSSALALATGLALGQIGEFSFVLAQVAAGGGLFDAELFRLILSVTVITLLLTPYLVRTGPWLLQGGRRSAREESATGLEPAECGEGDRRGHVIVAGFGPAGQEAATFLRDERGEDVLTVDMNPKNAAAAHDRGIQFVIGDATHAGVLEHLHVRCAAAVIVTIPDPASAVQIVRLTRILAPQARIAVRARYHISREDLVDAGAEVVVDEEREVGILLAKKAEALLEGGPVGENG
ncbi:MAG: cation:proton antiporter [Thermoleophilia bacterium]